MASSSAATAAIGWPTKTTRSMASTAWARVGALRLSSGMSRAVTMARTPGRALARVVSIFTILAWAWGLRSSLACSIPLGLMSATYCTCPVTFSGPSGRGMARPTPLISRVVFITAMTSGSLRGLRARDFGDRRQHLRVAGAPAQVAGDAVANLLFRGMRSLGQQRGGRHQHAGDAEATLGHAQTHERLLQRVQRARVGQPLDRAHIAAADLHG